MDRAEQLRERMAYRKQQMEIYQVRFLRRFFIHLLVFDRGSTKAAPTVCVVQMARRKSEIMKARRAQEIRELKSERSQ